MLNVTFDESDNYIIDYHEVIATGEPGDFFKSRDGTIFMVIRDYTDGSGEDKLVSLCKTPCIIHERSGYNMFMRLDFNHMNLRKI